MTSIEPANDLLLGDLEAAIRDYARADARSLQAQIGPSELGQACERRVAMTLLGAEKINDERDEWTSSVGTAIHTWMENALKHQNRLLAERGLPVRWLTEQTVEIRPGLSGHTDAYDLWTHTVLDHKFPGVTSIRKYKHATDPVTGLKGYPSEQYVWQAHTYGYGWAKLGFPVRKVAIAMYPRSGLVRDTWLWQADYDPAIAEKALARLDSLLVGMDVAESLGGLGIFLTSLKRDTANCSWCPFWNGGPRPADDPLKGCAGPFEEPGYRDPRHMSVPGILA